MSCAINPTCRLHTTTANTVNPAALLISFPPKFATGTCYRNRHKKLQKRKAQRLSCALQHVRKDAYLHESLTILTFVTVMWPCSLLLLLMCASVAVSFASSFMLCIVEFFTAPVAFTV